MPLSLRPWKPNILQMCVCVILNIKETNPSFLQFLVTQEKKHTSADIDVEEKVRSHTGTNVKQALTYLSNAWGKTENVYSYSYYLGFYPENTIS